MDNRINEIRRKISALRSEMTDVEAAIRDLVNHDQDCAETSRRLMAMRAQVAALVGEWKAAGGGERLPTFPARLVQGPRGRRQSAKAAGRAFIVAIDRYLAIDGQERKRCPRVFQREEKNGRAFTNTDSDLRRDRVGLS